MPLPSGLSLSRRAVSRRAFLALAGAALAAPPALGASPPRIACLDYGLAETMLALGVPPIAVGAAADWGTWVVEPPLPAGVADLAAFQNPNLERLAALRPDLVLFTDFSSLIEAALRQIAPVENLTIFSEGTAPLEQGRRAALRIGEILDRRDEAAAFVAGFDAELEAMRARLALREHRPLLLVSFLDSRHVRVYGARGLYGNVLDRLGLRNGWTGEVNYWGFATIGVEELATAPDARLIAIEPVAADVWPTLAHSPLWSGLPFVRDGQVSTMAPSLMFGTMPSALRFARLLEADLAGAGA